MRRDDMSLSGIQRDNVQWEGRSILTHVAYRREVFKKILRDVLERRLVIIYGPLGVGKTTLIKYLMDELAQVVPGTSMVHVPCDQEGYSPSEAINYFFEKIRTGEDIYVFIDEFLLMPDCESVIRELMARGDVKNIHMVLVSSYLPNREIDWGVEPVVYQLPPLSFREFLEYHDFEAPLLERDIYSVRDFYIEHLDYDVLYTKYLIRGGFPRLDLSVDDSGVRNWLKVMMDTQIYKYLPRAGRRKKPKIADKLLTMLCYEPGIQVNYNELAEAIGKDIRTVTSYVKSLEHAFMIRTIKHMVGRGQESRKMPRIYPYTPAYPLALHPEMMDDEAFMSAVVESHIIMERGVKAYMKRASGSAVLVYESDQGYIPILVRYVKRASKRDVKKVANALRRLGGDWGFLVVRETMEVHRYGDIEVWALPAWLFSLMRL